MKKLFKYILTYVILYILIFIIVKLIFNVLGIEFLNWVYNVWILTIIVGILVGIVQIIIKVQNKYDKIKIIICCICIIGLIAMFWQIFALFYTTFLPPEYIVKKDDKKMVGYVNAFLRTKVDYYEYYNVFFRSYAILIEEDYGKGGFDPLDEKQKYTHEVKETRYYDKNGNIIKTIPNNEKEDNGKENNIINNKNNNYDFLGNDTKSNISSETSTEKSVLYEKAIDEKIRIRVVNLETILAQRSVIDIEKSTDGGKTYTGQTEGGITIHNGAEFTFIDENIGFINDPGLAGTDGENKGFLVTTDGGKTFNDANIIHPDNIEEKNLLVKGVPYIEDGKLKLVIYTLNHSKNPERTYYEFISNDNWITWEFYKKKENIERKL